MQNIRSIILALFCVFGLLSGCSSSEKLVTPIQSTDQDSIRYSIIYVIHGDASYLYHQDGNAYQADKEALKEAVAVAKDADHGEVFIFHQKSEHKILWLFPKKDREFYHYVGGELVNKQKYSPSKTGLKKESELYNQHNIKTDKQHFFSYFGHEIPSLQKQSYYASRPNSLYDSDMLGEDISSFEPFFDLTVISTCNNGNPLMAKRLSGKTDVLVASPQNLHLSYMNTSKYLLLEEEPAIEPLALADSIAKNSFSELTSFLQTEVSIAVYNMKEIEPYIDSLFDSYKSHLKGVEKKPLFTNNIDCSKITALNEVIDTTGIQIYYSGARFGRRSGQKAHSGWGCKE